MCTAPLPARRVNGQIEFLGRQKDGRFFNNATATLQIPCGQCVECRLKRSREWAVRCMHEASLHRDNCFLTLTYSDDKLRSPSLQYKDFQGFMKRLRSRFPKDKMLFFVVMNMVRLIPVLMLLMAVNTVLIFIAFCLVLIFRTGNPAVC